MKNACPERSIVSLTTDNIAHLYQEYRQKIFGYFKKRGCSFPECENLTQDTFLQAFDKRSTFKGQGSEAAWLYGIARNRYNNFIRECKTQITTEPMSQQEDQYKTHDRDPSESALEMLIKNSQRAILNAGVRSLPPEQGRTLLLFSQGKSYQEIAENFQKPLNTVKSALFKAKAKLVQLIADSGQG